MTRIFAFRRLACSHNELFRSCARTCSHQRLETFKKPTPSFRTITSSSSVFKKHNDDDEEFIEVKPPPRPSDHPFERTVKILKHDLRSLYDKTQAPLLEFSSHVDIVIIGGGIIGSAIAYHIKERTPREALRVMVIEKDPEYSRSATAMSIGGLRQHFTLRENVEMAQFSAEFFRQVHHKLACGDEAPPDIKYHPYGYLHLSDEEHAEELQECWLAQKELGCHVELLTKERLKDRFPWMNTDGVELACYGTQGQGWFDAWALHFGYKRKAIYHGTEYVHGEVVGFDFEKTAMFVAGMDYGDEYINAKRVLVKSQSGEVKSVHYAYCIIAAGHESANIADMARIGRGKGLLSVPLPVQPRKRNVYCIQAPDGPGIDCPLVVDVDGTYFRREGYAGHFVAGHAPAIEGNEVGNLDVDYDYFDNTVWPRISHRVPGFTKLKLNSAWAGYYDYNTFDQSGILGPHPYYPNMYFACGFSGYGIQQAPAIARAVNEMILDGEFRTIDMHKFLFERFLVGKEIKENIVS